AACAAKGRGIAPPEQVRAVRTFRQWDECIVVPRFSFRDAAHYYESMSVAPRLRELRVPSLLVLAHGDPMVPPAVVTPWLPPRNGAISPMLDVRWTGRGGHLGFPRDLDLGFGEDRGLSGQLASFARQVGGSLDS